MQRHKSLLRPPAQQLPASISWLLPPRRTAAAATSIGFTAQLRQSLFFAQTDASVNLRRVLINRDC
jgi:hypothetical protein